MPSKTAFVAVLFLLLPLCASASVIDRTVAIVNNDTITLSEVNDAGGPLFRKISGETPANQREAMLRKAQLMVIDKLIEKKLIMQEAKKYNIQISDQEVENAFQRIAAINKITPEQLRKAIANEGMSEKQYREELRAQALSSKLINHEVRTKVIISDDAILKYYNTQHITSAGAAYHLLHIGCSWTTKTKKGPEYSQEVAKQKAEEARNLATKGNDFKELVKKYSNLPSAADGGDIGQFQYDEMAPFIRDAVTQLQPGEVSQVVESKDAYHVFKLLSRQQDKVVARESLDEVKDQIREKLHEQALEQRFKEWITSIRGKAYIKIL